MSAKKTGLGRGLDALIPGIPKESALPETQLNRIPIDHIQVNPEQPRSKFDPEELNDLSNSILEHGIIQPLVVSPGLNEGQYILIAGERRLQAASLAGLKEVPVVVRTANNQELLELALIENVQRADLSPLETANAYSRLQKEYSLTQEEVAQRVGKSRVSVTNTLRLLELSAPVKQALANAEISEGHGRAIHGLSSQAQAALLDLILKNGLNVRQTEELARKYKGEKSSPASKRAALGPEIIEIQDQLREHFQTEVKLTYGQKGGTITLRYFSDEELNKLVSSLLKKGS